MFHDIVSQYCFTMDLFRSKLNINLKCLTDMQRTYYNSAASFKDLNFLIQSLFVVNGVGWVFKELCHRDRCIFSALIMTKYNNELSGETCILDHLPSVLNDHQITNLIELLTKDVFKRYLKSSYAFIRNLGLVRPLCCIYYYIDEDLLLSYIDDDVMMIGMMVYELRDRVDELRGVMALDWDRVLNTRDRSGVSANDYLTC